MGSALYVANHQRLCLSMLTTIIERVQLGAYYVGFATKNLSGDGDKNMLKYLNEQLSTSEGPGETSPIDLAIQTLKEEANDLILRAEALQKGLAELNMSLDNFRDIMELPKTPPKTNEVGPESTKEDAPIPEDPPQDFAPILPSFGGPHGPDPKHPRGCLCGCSPSNPCQEEECIHCGPEHVPWGRNLI